MLVMVHRHPFRALNKHWSIVSPLYLTLKTVGIGSALSCHVRDNTYKSSNDEEIDAAPSLNLARLCFGSPYLAFMFLRIRLLS